MTLSPSEVTALTSALSRWETAEYIFTGLVVLACFGEYAADFTTWFTGDQNHRKERLARISTLLLIGSLALELLCLVRTNQLSGNLIGALGDRAMMAFGDADAAVGRADSASKKAQNAEDASGRAVDKSGKAEASAARAMATADVARQEADAFKDKIDSAVKLANEAEAHLKDALAQASSAASLANGYAAQINDAKRDAAEAKALLSEVRQLASEARAGVTRLQSKRSLAHQDELVEALKQYAGTKYGFSAVNADTESTDLLIGIDNVLNRAGWSRETLPSGISGINIPTANGTITVASLPREAIQISVESRQALALLQSLPPTKLPANVNAAKLLNLRLSESLTPHKDSDDRGILVTDGDSQIVQISVGKLPP